MDKQELPDEIVIPASYAGKRADIIISELIPSITRVQIKRLIEQNNILINDLPVKPSKKLLGGETIRIAYVQPEEIDIAPEDIDTEFIYEDDDIAVINKPAGLSVHPGAGIKSGTLVNALLYKCKNLSGIGGKIRPGIVHRLDKDTSGIMVVAKNDLSHNFLVEQFKGRNVKKKYIALLAGNLKEKSGEITLPIGRHRTDRIKFSSDSNSTKTAVTKWSLVKNYQGACLVEASPHTGRTHQIRVHFSEIGHPILGDKLYGHKIQDAFINNVSKRLGRQALHAFSLSFEHPRDRKMLYFEAPLPEDIKEAVGKLKQYD
ncbi:MAG: RluA family pseudouridine synthase [Candidatus Dadabacteria bacterium]|nr:RluA family pseudouridine synthase [Candidatus Dadabacteria bacterium]NIV41586.1 RluA family pseudouridine synthase [Candidatus Dadabacteria bacterium]NIX15148.1 RluA family pseudouridine synthase [Candidatus Dadabacteria bacterium]NIY21793.1 RluA family pseudouridine synthase [Candidatus Dadabacteria bacterium]